MVVPESSINPVAEELKSEGAVTISGPPEDVFNGFKGTGVVPPPPRVTVSTVVTGCVVVVGVVVLVAGVELELTVEVVGAAPGSPTLAGAVPAVGAASPEATVPVDAV